MAKRSASTKQPQELQWYDERSYPRSADSDMESEIGSEISVDSEDHTSVNMEEIVRDSNVQTDLIEDFICVICAQLLVDPTTLHCGHSFCQLCLANVLETRPGQLQCPVCRQPWRNIPGINIQLRSETNKKNYGQTDRQSLIPRLPLAFCHWGSLGTRLRWIHTYM